MPGQHAKLSPSAAERWLECPASIRMEEQFPGDGDSVYAAEGTLAHTLGEIKARRAFGMINETEYLREREDFEYSLRTFLKVDKFNEPLFVETLAEMDRHTDSYVILIKERVAAHPNSAVLFEQRLDTGVRECQGTTDTVIVSPVHVEIIDFKYGQGVRVDADGNPQLRLYGVAALDTYGDVLGDTETVTATIHQPRLDHVVSEVLTSEEIRNWRTLTVVPIAEEALGDDAHFGPGETACRWCAASGHCKAQLESIFTTNFEEPVDTLTPEQVAEVKPKLGQIRDWLSAFEVAALDMAYSQGKTIPGYKVVLSGGQRSFTDKAAAIRLLVSTGWSMDDVAKTEPALRGIGELEALMGKSEFASVLKPFIKPPQGKPALVLESDPRPSINPNTEASKTFGEDLL